MLSASFSSLPSHKYVWRGTLSAAIQRNALTNYPRKSNAAVAVDTDVLFVDLKYPYSVNTPMARPRPIIVCDSELAVERNDNGSNDGNHSDSNVAFRSGSGPFIAVLKRLVPSLNSTRDMTTETEATREVKIIIPVYHSVARCLPSSTTNRIDSLWWSWHRQPVPRAKLQRDETQTEN